ncbi:MAG: flagellar basal body L-ring protein FlgH [Myxococcales bacterium]|nr:flagellar basal body L-ring protein FlgH [Myxococcales bacterium]
MTFLLLAALVDPSHARRQAAPPSPPEPPIAIEPAEQSEPASPGSLFDDVQARRLMGMDGYARRRGDLVTVQILEESRTSLAAETDTSKANSHTANLRALLGIEKRILKASKDLEEIGFDLGSGADFSGGGQTQRDSDVQAIITCQVIDVLPGGNLRIWGWKQVRVNREIQYVVLDGIARPRDIQLDNTVSSDLLAQARIEFTGSGVIADRQGPGWLSRVLDKLWPF